MRGRARRPAGADDDKQDVADADRIGDLLDEVDARRQVHIHEHVVIPKPRSDSVIETPGVTGGLFPPIADEHLRRSRVHWRSPSWRAASSRWDTHAACSCETRL